MHFEIATVRVSTAGGKFRQTVEIGPHRMVADEGESLGGEDAGPAPLEWLLAGLGACTSMTLKMYAERKGWPLVGVDVTLNGDHTAEGFVIDRKIELDGPELTEEQRQSLLVIANKCPVHKTLVGNIEIRSELA